MAWKNWLGRILLALGCLLASVCPGQAVEDAQGFLNALREKGYFDTALDYLEWLRTSRFCPEGMKETLNYEAAMTNLMASLGSQDMKYRVEYLDKARQLFDAFLNDHPSHPLASDARLQLGNVLVERAKIKREQANKSTTPAEEKTKLIKEARDHLDEAKQVFTELETYFTNERRKYGKTIDPKWPEKKKQEFEDVVRNMAMARLNLATVEYEIALTYPPKSREANDQLFSAARKFGEVYEGFKDWLAGSYARYWQARCYKEMGDEKNRETAQKICQELLTNLPDEHKTFREIKNKTLILELEMLQEAKNYAEVMKKVEEWLGTARGDEETSPEGLAIRFHAAQAGDMVLQQQKEKKDPKLYNLVRDYYRFVARYEGPHQMAARIRLRELAEGPMQVTSYAEARDYGKAALDELQAAEVELRLSAGQGDLDEKKKKELEQRMQSAQEEAKTYFQQALQLALKEPPERQKDLLDEVNTLRYYLAYLYYLSDDLYEAAVLGEFLARKYPNSGGARPGAKIALACWVKMRSSLGKEEDRQFETDHMTRLAEYIAGRWADAPEAEEAMIMLLRSAVADQDPQKALEYLKRLRPDSPKKSEAEVLIGQALWSAYVRTSRLPDDQRPDQNALDQMRQQAQQYLEQGIEGLRKQVTDQTPVDYTLASAMLSLVQIYIETGQTKQALEKLTDAQAGPLTLVQANHPLCDRGTFRPETYKAALRTYVAERQLEKAEEVMNTLEKLMAGPEGAAKLTQLYISLGLELQRTLNRLRQERKEQDAQQILEGFKLFLDRIAQRPNKEFNSSYWVAETYQSLGAGLDPGTTRTCPPDAKEYYEKAVDAYQKLLEQIEEGKLQGPEGVHITLQLRMAKCLRRLGQYKEALQWITLVLNEKPMMIDAQVEGAYICQARGAEDPKYYIYAIQGGLKAKGKDGKEFTLPIWGWGRLARTVQRFMMDPRMDTPERQAEKQRMADYFHEARYNLALCRFEYGKTLSGDRRGSVLQQAEDDVLIVHRLMPELGGPEWASKYNDLLKRIQQTLGKPAEGLPKSKPSTASTTGSSQK